MNSTLTKDIILLQDGLLREKHSKLNMLMLALIIWTTPKKTDFSVLWMFPWDLITPLTLQDQLAYSFLHNLKLGVTIFIFLQSQAILRLMDHWEWSLEVAQMAPYLSLLSQSLHRSSLSELMSLITKGKETTSLQLEVAAVAWCLIASK